MYSPFVGVCPSACEQLLASIVLLAMSALFFVVLAAIYVEQYRQRRHERRIDACRERQWRHYYYGATGARR